MQIETKEQPQYYIESYYKDLKNHLQNLLKDEIALNKIAQESYNHPNHFAKLILNNDKEAGIKLRLHIWENPLPNQSTKLFSEVHNHRWSFVSIPLLGTFKELRFKEIEEAPPSEKVFSVYKYECYPRSQSSQEIKGGAKVTLLQNEECIRSAGELYFCDAGAVHHYEPITYPAASLILTFNTIEGYALMYKDSPISDVSEDLKIVTPSLTVEDVRNLLMSLLEKL
jgi:hypothetical protein